MRQANGKVAVAPAARPSLGRRSDVTSGESKQRSAGLQWAIDRVVGLVTKAADNLLWLGLLALVGYGGFAALKKKLEGAGWLLRWALYVVLALVVVALLAGAAKKLLDRRRARKAELARLQREALLAEAQRELLYNALESVQMAIGSDETWDVDALVERGILGPVRGLLVRSDLDDVRLAVLIPDDEDDHFLMRWAAGHRPESVEKFKRPIDLMLAGEAYRNGDFKVCPDVRNEPGFVPNPNATRDFASLVAVPLRVHERLVGVLSVISTEIDAFSESDISFIKIVGAVTDVILAAEYDAGLFEAAIEEAEQRGRAEDPAPDGRDEPALGAAGAPGGEQEGPAGG